MHNKIYTAITIGPISATLAKAHKTREIWLASFMFSKFMEDVIDCLKKQNGDFQFVLPNINKKRPNIDKALSPGIFPDRLMITSSAGIRSEMEKAIEFAKDNLADDIVSATSIIKPKVKDYINRFLSIHLIEGEVPATEHPVFYINNILANQELRAPYIPMGEDIVQRYLEEALKSKYYIEFGSKIKSIEDIAGVDKNDSRSSQYISIVQADGDSIGRLISSIKNVEMLQLFSEGLSSFSSAAVEEIISSGGFPIYAGGDDLLWFSPVKHEKQSVFELLEKIDTIFKTEIIDNPVLKNLIEAESGPSMSYGVSISYYKHPMHEALSYAADLLFYKAKKTPNKNSVAYRLMKHSGQTVEGILNKDILKILIAYDKPAFNSVMYNMENQKVQLIKLLSNMDDNRMHEFFANNYNEPNHNEKKPFFESVTNALMKTYALTSPTGMTENQKTEYAEKAIHTVIDMLYIEKFLNQAKHESNG